MFMLPVILLMSFAIPIALFFVAIMRIVSIQENARTEKSFPVLTLLTALSTTAYSIHFYLWISYFDPPYNRPLASPFSAILLCFAYGTFAIALAQLILNSKLSLKQKGKQLFDGIIIGVPFGLIAKLALQLIKNSLSENTLTAIATLLNKIAEPINPLKQYIFIFIILFVVLILVVKLILSKKNLEQ